MGDRSESINALWQKIKRIAQLKYEYARLTFAERLTMILAMMAVGLVALIGVMFVLFFLSVALAQWIASSLGMMWASLIVAGVYLVLLILVIALRKYLFVNPISKFITRMFL